MRPSVITTPLLTLVTLALASGTATAQTQPPPAAPPPATTDLAPPEYPPPSARWGVVAAGLGTTAVAYGAALGASYIYPDVPGTNQLRIPVAGPWLAIAHNGCPARRTGLQQNYRRAALDRERARRDCAQAGGLRDRSRGSVHADRDSELRAPSCDSERRLPPQPPPSSPSQGEKNLFFIPTPMNMGERGIGVGVVGRF